MSVFRDSARQVTTAAIVAAVSFVTSIVLARSLGSREFGLYSLMLAFSTTSVMLTQLGWTNAVTFALRLRERPAAEIFTGGLLATLGICACLAFSLTLFASPLRELFMPSAPDRVFALGAAIVPAQLLGFYAAGAARGIGRFDLSNRYSLFTALGTLLAVVALVLVRGGDAAGAITVTATSNLVAATWLLSRVARRTGLASRIAATGLLRDLRYGAKSYVQTILATLHDQTGVFLLAAHTHDPVRVAALTLSLSLLNRVRLFTDGVAGALFPALAERGRAEAVVLAARAARLGTLAVAIACVALVFVGPLALPWLYGAEFEGAVPPFTVLAPSLVFHTLFLLLARFFMATDRQERVIALLSVAFVGNAALNVLLLPSIGVLAAAVASLASQAFLGSAMLFVFCRSTGVPTREVVFPRSVDWLFLHAEIDGWVARGRGIRVMPEKRVGR